MPPTSIVPAISAQRNVALRLFHFGAHAIQILPAVISPQRSSQRRKKLAHRSNAPTRRPKGMEVLHASVPEPESRCDDRQHRGNFQNRKRDLHASTQPHTQVIDECEKRDHRHRQRLRPSEFEIVRLAGDGVAEVPRKNRHGNHRNQKARKSRESRSDGRCRTGFTHCRMHPPKKKSPHWAEPFSQVSVLPARFRQRRAQLRERKRPEKRKQAAHNPRRVDNAHRPAHRRHLARLQKNSCAHHRANHDGRRGPWAQRTYQVESLTLSALRSRKASPSPREDLIRQATRSISRRSRKLARNRAHRKRHDRPCKHIPAPCERRKPIHRDHCRKPGHKSHERATFIRVFVPRAEKNTPSSAP